MNPHQTKLDACRESLRRHMEMLRERDERLRERDERDERLTDILRVIEIYATDTLSKPKNGPDDRKWYRDGVIEIVKRVRAALNTEAPK